MLMISTPSSPTPVSEYTSRAAVSIELVRMGMVSVSALHVDTQSAILDSGNCWTSVFLRVWARARGESSVSQNPGGIVDLRGERKMRINGFKFRPFAAPLAAAGKFCGIFMSLHAFPLCF